MGIGVRADREISVMVNKQRGNIYSRNILIAINTSWNAVNFRSGLIEALIESGCNVTVISPNDRWVTEIEKLGCKHIHISIQNMGKNIFVDAVLVCQYIFKIWQISPDVLLAYTVKPNIYGSLACAVLGVPVINNISGLGSVFIKRSKLTGIVKFLYKLALSRSHKVFFQNADDLYLFCREKLVRPHLTTQLPGSGINLERFQPYPVQQEARPLRFLLPARMLWDKGVGEYVDAARQLRARYPDVEFCLLGFIDVENPAAISRRQMDAWGTEGVILYLGETDDVRPFIADSDCVVLPSYREGTPRALLEAAAMGRVVVAADSIGCRDVVDHEQTGFLCKVGDAFDLATQLERVILLSRSKREQMGKAARRKMEREFDEKIVISHYLEAIALTVADRDEAKV